MIRRVTKPTTTGELRRAREMRAAGRSVEDIAGELGRGTTWASRHTKDIAPRRDRGKRQRTALGLRALGLKYSVIRERLGYPSETAARLAVYRARRRQKEEVTA